MFEEVVKFARNQQCKTLSLNTYKEKFPSMYSFCINEQFVEYATENDSTGSLKSKFTKKL